MPTGLLADLVLMMSSSPEDVATRALELLLARSPAGRATMDRLINEWRGRAGTSAVRWVSQVVAQDGGRTDLEGHGPGDKTLAILENKFWAGLTVNQPTTYLDRLPATDGILVFVAPAKRVPVLAYELGLRLTPLADRHDAFRATGESHVAHLASGKTLAVTSWTALLTSIGTAMETAGEFDNVADLKQLQALVVRMDREGFRPFSLTDLTADTPRLILQLCGLIDSVVQQLLTRPHVTRKGLRASAGQGWYGHYLKIHGFGCQLNVSAPYWSTYGLSPIWFRVSGADWKFSDTLRPLLTPLVPDSSWLVEDRRTGWQGHWLPLRIAEGREREAVVTDLLRQIEAIAGLLSAHEQPERDVEPGSVDPADPAAS